MVSLWGCYFWTGGLVYDRQKMKNRKIQENSDDEDSNKEEGFVGDSE